VTLTSGPAGITTPASITIPAGASTGTFTISTIPVTKATSGTILASANSSAFMAALTVKAPVLATLSFSADPAVGGTTVHGTVTINGPAPTGGLLIDGVTDSKSAIPVGVIKVLAGEYHATFDITTLPVLTKTIANITVRANGVQLVRPLHLIPTSLIDVSLSPSSVAGGGVNQVTGTVLLDGIAPSHGVVVQLISSNPGVASVPATVTIASGALSATFSVTPASVAASTDVTITASYASVTKQAVLTVTPPVLTDLSVRPATVQGSSSVQVTGTVTLSAPTPIGGVTISLSSSMSTMVTVPATVTIPAGATFATFTVNHYGVTAKINVTISATQGNLTKTAPLSVTP